MLFKHVAESGKHAGNQPINFIVKAEPAERLSPFGGTSTSGFNLQPVMSQQHNSTLLRSQISPGRTSPMEYSSYNLSRIQQYQPNIQSNIQPNIQLNIQPNIPPIMQQADIPVTMDIQQFSYQTQLPDQSQLQSQHQQTIANNLPMLNKVTPNQSGFQPLNNNGATCLLDMDNQQFIDWNSAELADFGANLCANLSTGLSISDSIQPEANNDENNMNEGISWISQDLSLHKIFKTHRENSSGHN